MRRRSLLAVCESGVSNLNGFYADFNFDYCEGNILYKYCYRASDDLGVACYNEAKRLIDEYGVVVATGIIDLENPINYGFEVYIEGALVTTIHIESNALYLHIAEGEYSDSGTQIFQTGELSWEY